MTADYQGKYDTERSKREMEMIRMCGSIPAESIEKLKSEMSEFIRVNRKSIMELEGTYPAPFDYRKYKEEHNHIDLVGPMNTTSQKGFWGATKIVSDIHELDEEERDNIVVDDIVPPVMLNDLAIKISGKTMTGNRKTFYELQTYDAEKELLYISRYEHHPAEEKKTAPKIEKPILFGMAKEPLSLPRTEYIPAYAELIEGAIIPIRWVFAMLIVGMNCRWVNKDFADFPILVTWHEDEPYQLYRNFGKKNLTYEWEGGEHGIVEDLIESSIGFQRYLIALSEDRESVSIKREKESKGESKKTTPAAVERTENKPERHIISLKDDIRVYTNNTESVKRFRHFQKCPYRFSVRGHFRHYKSGKTVWIKPFDKNKNKPFNSHKYKEL